MAQFHRIRRQKFPVFGQAALANKRDQTASLMAVRFVREYAQKTDTSGHQYHPSKTFVAAKNETRSDEASW